MDLKYFVDNEQTIEELNLIWEISKKIEELNSAGKIGKNWLKKIGDGKNIAVVLDQPSTRTRLKFSLAGQIVGANVNVLPISSSSMVKGEQWYDTMLTLSAMEIDVVAIRHPSNHLPQQLVSICRGNSFPISIINGGDGNNLHPVQVLGDGFTLKEHFGKRFGKERLKIAVGADPKNSRVLHSLVRMLANFPIALTIVSWRPEFKMPRKYLREFIQRNGRPREVTRLPSGEKFDVIYWTRYQIEHGPKEPRELNERWQKEYNQKCRITPRSLNKFLMTDGIFLYPGPRTKEIDKAIDKDPRVKYKEQLRNGDITTAALYTLMLNPGFYIPRPSEF